MINEKLIDFVKPYYETKDIMHDLSHIKRIWNSVLKLGKDYPEADQEALFYGCYFHGIIYAVEDQIKDFLTTEGFTEHRINFIVQVAWESQKDRVPKTLEGKILHDAHLIEGGKTFIIVKCLITGTARGQSLAKTIHIIENNILGNRKCYLPKAVPIYQEMQEFAQQFISDLKDGLKE